MDLYNVIVPSDDFDFSGLYLETPVHVSSSVYYAKLYRKPTGRSVYIQTPQASAKNGMDGPKVDLMLPVYEGTFIQWMENLETACQQFIYAKREDWFSTPLTQDDIESMFTPVFKMYKSGALLRANKRPDVRILDETMSTITAGVVPSDAQYICIIEIGGVRCTSRNFQLDMEIKQILAVSANPFLDKCFITMKKDTVVPSIAADTNTACAEPDPAPEPASSPDHAGVVPVSLDALDMDDDADAVAINIPKEVYQNMRLKLEEKIAQLEETLATTREELHAIIEMGHLDD